MALIVLQLQRVVKFISFFFYNFLTLPQFASNAFCPLYLMARLLSSINLTLTPSPVYQFHSSTSSTSFQVKFNPQPSLHSPVPSS